MKETTSDIKNKIWLPKIWEELGGTTPNSIGFYYVDGDTTFMGSHKDETCISIIWNKNYYNSFNKFNSRVFDLVMNTIKDKFEDKNCSFYKNQETMGAPAFKWVFVVVAEEEVIEEVKLYLDAYIETFKYLETFERNYSLSLDLMEHLKIISYLGKYELEGNSLRDFIHEKLKEIIDGEKNRIEELYKVKISYLDFSEASWDSEIKESIKILEENKKLENELN